MRRRRDRAAAALPWISALLLAACGEGKPAPGGSDLATVEVTAQPDADASLAADAVATPIGMTPRGVAGALPGDFPREVPLPSPSSLVDFAHRGGERSVTVEVDLPAEQVAETYRRQLAASGFRELPDGRWSGHEQIVSFSTATLHDATRLTVRVTAP